LEVYVDDLLSAQDWSNDEFENCIFVDVVGVSVILGQMPADQIQRAMKEICWFQISPLCQLVEVS